MSHRDAIITPSRSHHRHSPRRRHSSSSPHRPNPAYVIEAIPPSPRRQRGLKSGEELKAELAAAERQGARRVVVIRGGWGGVGEAMRTVLGADAELTVWEYPGVRHGEDEGVRFLRLGVWMEGRVPVVILDDAMLRSPRLPEGPSTPAFEDGLWDAFYGDDDSQTLEDVTAELAYEQWLALSNSLTRDSQGQTPMLWAAMRALERNTDSARRLQKHGRPVSKAINASWATLTDRIHRRLHLSLLTSPRPLPERDDNARSLDRISYLGGLLLPLTVVSGILAMDGPFGPRGARFWVFWLVAGVSSVLALLVIHADQVRTLEVWIEDVAAGGLEAGGSGGPWARGSDGRIWRRRELGWAGAVKKMSGWYRWRGSPGLVFRMPTLEERVRRMVQT